VFLCVPARILDRLLLAATPVSAATLLEESSNSPAESGNTPTTVEPAEPLARIVGLATRRPPNIPENVLYGKDRTLFMGAAPGIQLSKRGSPSIENRKEA
jgi:hypothetical protein